MDLVSKIKDIQRQSLEGRLSWKHFCKSLPSDKCDPALHDAVTLRAFLNSLDHAYTDNRTRGKGRTRRMEWTDIRTHRDLNKLSDSLGGRVKEVLQSANPKSHQDYWTLKRDLDEFNAITPYDSELHFYIEALLSKITES